MPFLQNFTKRQLIILGSILLVIILMLLLLTGIIPGLVRKKTATINLTLAGFEDRQAMEALINGFQEINPQISIKYRQIDQNGYENAIINSLASNDSPDIFMFHNTWLPEHMDKLAPAIADQITTVAVDSLFPTVARQDFAPDDLIWALPLYIDTLALYYNKEAFDSASIALPPQSWLTFNTAINKLPFPAAAIGGSPRNIFQATDILNMLMLQTGVKMVDENFNQATFSGDGLTAFNFYLSFADPRLNSKTWDQNQRYSLDLFAEGSLPMMFAYRRQAALLKQKAPLLDFGVTEAPQPATAGPKVTFPSYYGLAVSSRGTNQRAAWDFILYATTNAEAVQRYLTETGLPPALRSLIQKYANDPELGIFARQALTARSWPQIDSSAIESIFGNMIESVLGGFKSSSQALQDAETAINLLMQKRF